MAGSEQGDRLLLDGQRGPPCVQSLGFDLVLTRLGLLMVPAKP